MDVEVVGAGWTGLDTARGRFGARFHGERGPLVVGLHGFPDDASTYDGLAAASPHPATGSPRSTCAGTPRRR